MSIIICHSRRPLSFVIVDVHHHLSQSTSIVIRRSRCPSSFVIVVIHCRLSPSIVVHCWSSPFVEIDVHCHVSSSIIVLSHVYERLSIWFCLSDLFHSPTSVHIRPSLSIFVDASYSSNRMYYVHMYPISYSSNHMYVDTLRSPKLNPRWALVFKTVELWGLESMLLVLSTKKGRGACWSSEMGLGREISFSYLLKPATSQPTSWFVRILEHLWC